LQSSKLHQAWNSATHRYLSGYTPRQALERISRRAVSPLLIRATSFSTHDLRNTLLIAGSPRSGTTFLAELLNQIPRSAILFEPEHIQQVPEARRAGLTWHTFKDPREDWPEGRRFFERALRGRLITGWTVSHVPLSKAIAPRTWIVKFVDANFMLGWLAANFPVRAPILLIRHPCAVIASQLRRGWSNPHPPRLKGFLARYPQFADYLETLRDPAEFAAALWSMQTLAPLSLPRPWPFVLLTYEELAADPSRELERLFATWQMPMPSGIVERAMRPSGTTDTGSALAAGSDPSSAWRRSLSASQIDGILGVIRTFGLDFYDESPYPDPDRLSAFSPPRPDAGSQPQ
jgi:hypothetical protein